MTWEYLAGFFDGEGNISLQRQKHNGEGRYSRGSPRISIVQAEERGRKLLEEIAEFIRPYGIPSVVEMHQAGTDKWKKAYHLRVTGFNGVIQFLGHLFPYLHIKKLEAQDLIRYNCVFPSLKGKGHSHSENTRKSWETRRRLYVNGYKRSETPGKHGMLGAIKRWQ